MTLLVSLLFSSTLFAATPTTTVATSPAVQTVYSQGTYVRSYAEFFEKADGRFAVRVNSFFRTRPRLPLVRQTTVFQPAGTLQRIGSDLYWISSSGVRTIVAQTKPWYGGSGWMTTSQARIKYQVKPITKYNVVNKIQVQAELEVLAQ